MAEEDFSKPATKGDLAGLEARFETRLDERLAASEARLLEAIRDSQAELLRAFERHAMS